MTYSAGWKEYSGVVHVHTDKSGGLPFDRIVEAAKRTKADFVVITDNNVSMSEALEKQGWHDGILVLFGEEVCCIDGHFLAFQTREEIGLTTDYEHSIEAVRRQAGAVVGIHYHYEDLSRPSNVPAPLPVKLCDMVEIWSFHDEFVSRARGRMPIQFHSRPDRLLSGPPRHVMEDWDAELTKRPVAAVGSVNALNRKDPLLDWKEYFPFTTSFKTIRTHIVCPELPKNGTLAARYVWNALVRGHSFIANHALANPAGFRLRYSDEFGMFDVGDSAPYSERGELHIELPQEAEVIIRHNGSPLFWGTGESFTFPVPSTGVTRLEAKLDRRMWILSNPMRIVEIDDNPRRPSTVIDFT